MKQIKISDEIYGAKLFVVWECKQQEALRFFESKLDDGAKFEPLPNVRASHFYHKHKSLIFIDIEKEFDALLIHELSHFCFHVFDAAGIDIDVDTEEVYAYYFDYIYNKIYKEIGKDFKKYAIGNNKISHYGCAHCESTIGKMKITKTSRKFICGKCDYITVFKN